MLLAICKIWPMLILLNLNDNLFKEIIIFLNKENENNILFKFYKIAKKEKSTCYSQKERIAKYIWEKICLTISFKNKNLIIE